MILQRSRCTRHSRSTTRRPHASSEFIYLSPFALFSIVLCSIYATLLCRLAHNAGLLHALAPLVFVVVLCLDFPSRIGTASISFWSPPRGFCFQKFKRPGILTSRRHRVPAIVRARERVTSESLSIQEEVNRALLQLLPSVEPTSPDKTPRRLSPILSDELSAADPTSVIDGTIFNPQRPPNSSPSLLHPHPFDTPTRTTRPRNMADIQYEEEMGDPTDDYAPEPAQARGAPAPVQPRTTTVPTVPPPVEKMPLRNQRTAPVFSDNPRELKRYFGDLEILLERAGINDDEAKKRFAVHYLPVDTADLWESQEAFEDEPYNTYRVFKASIYKLYPGAEDDRKYVAQDMDDLIKATRRAGINTRAEYGAYMRKMKQITTFLKARGSVSENEARRAYVWGLPEELREKVLRRLQVKSPDTPHDIPFSIAEVDAACKWFLQGSGTPGQVSAYRSPYDQAPFDGGSRASERNTGSRVGGGSAPSPEIKAEDIRSMFQNLHNAINRIEGGQRRAPPSTPDRAQSGGINQTPPHLADHMDRPTQPPPTRRGGCYFCTENGHMMGECPHVQQYIRDGKCRRNAEGNFVLPSGAWPPFIRGASLKERFDDYHQKNPNQLATGSLMLNIVTDNVESPAVQLEQARRELNLVQGRQGMGLAPPPTRQRSSLPVGMYTMPSDLLSQLHEKQYSTTIQTPSITNRQALFVREVAPHLEQSSTISANTARAVNDDPEITELTREAFIASTRANRRLSRDNTTKAVEDRSRPGEQKKARVAEGARIREVADEEKGERGKGREAMEEADKENRDRGNEEQSGKESRESTVIGDEQPVQPSVANLSPQNEPQVTGNRPSTSAIEHPFANVRDGYAPPVARNLGAIPKPVRNRDAPSYQNVAPIIADNPSVTRAMLERSLTLPITATLSELLALSPDLRKLYREATTTRRVIPPVDPTTKMYTLDGSVVKPYVVDIEGVDPAWDLEEILDQSQDLRTAPQQSTENLAAAYVIQEVPLGMYSATDPYEDLVKSLPSGSAPPKGYTVVADESVLLRSIWPKVAEQEVVECVVDPGCQIIAMSEVWCNRLGLQYDPSVILRMESANGSVDSSLGLSRDVPFQFGDITIYLQVHILRNPAYDVLLGRPFDTLTESVVKNYRNEETSVTITCPNSKRQATIPTRARGSKRRYERPGFPPESRM